MTTQSSANLPLFGQKCVEGFNQINIFSKERHNTTDCVFYRAPLSVITKEFDEILKYFGFVFEALSHSAKKINNLLLLSFVIFYGGNMVARIGQ
jgi:hypothetical protein